MKISITLPVYNEAVTLESAVKQLVAFLKDSRFPYAYEIVIADNKSTDATPAVATSLAESIPTLRYLRLPRKGRGFALKHAWCETACPIAVYMDIDLSTDLTALREVVQALIDDELCVVVTGSRLDDESVVRQRPALREFLSRSYNLFIRCFFRTSLKDAQCGFKAVKTAYFKDIVAAIENDNWFFDSELLLLTEHLGKRVLSVPVTWVDDPSSTVKVLGTIAEDIKGLIRVRYSFVGSSQISALRRKIMSKNYVVS